MTRELDALAARDPDARDAAAILRAVLAAAAALPAGLPPGVPDVEAARLRLSASVPALHGEPLADGATLRRNVAALAESLGAVPMAGETAAEVARRLLGDLDPAAADALAEAALAGAWEAVAELARALDLDEHLVRLVVDLAVQPALRAASAVVVPDAAAAGAAGWRRGICPACGAAPLLAELRGAQRERVMRCGRCAAAWEFPRGVCPGCGERDHRRLRLLHARGEEDFRRVSCCERCLTALKEVAVLSPLDATGLAEMDLATAALDFLAIERGHHR